MPFRVLIDWEHDGTFSHPYDDVSLSTRANPSMKMQRGMDQVRPLGTIKAGSIDPLELDNTNGIFSPENGASPLAGLLDGGTTVKVQISSTAQPDTPYDSSIPYDAPIPYDGVNSYADVTTQVIDDIQPRPEKLNMSTGFPCLGFLAQFRSTGNSSQNPPLYTGLYQSITTGQAIGHVLDALGFPSAQRIIATGDITMQWWWVSGQDGLQALQDLVNTEGPGARLYEDASGNIVFENHNYRFTTARSTTSQATFVDGSPTFPGEPGISGPFGYDPGEKDVINNCTATCVLRSAKTPGTQVWSSTETITIPANTSITRFAQTSDPFLNAITPVQGTDFIVPSGTITGVVLGQTSGAYAGITLTAGASGATVTNLSLRATPVTVDSSFDLSTTIDMTKSIAAHKKKIYPLTLRQEIDPNTLQDLVNAIPLWFQSAKAKGSFILIAGSDSDSMGSRYTQAWTRQISDRITLKIASPLFFNTDVWIESVGLEVLSAGKYIRATFGWERCLAVGLGGGPFILDQSDLDDSNYGLGF